MKAIAKSCLSLMLLVLVAGSAQAAKKQSFSVNLNGEELMVSGNIEIKGYDFIIGQIELRVAGDDTAYSLATGQAWGSRPLDQLCERITDGKNSYSYIGDNTADVDSSPNENILVLVPNEFKGGDVKKIVRGTRRDSHLYLKNLVCTKHLQEFYQ